MDLYTQLARVALTAYLKEREIIKAPKDLPSEILKRKAGTFVSLHKKRGHALRGCMGTFLPTEKNIATEIIRNAIAAATQDPRFEPLEFEELKELSEKAVMLEALNSAVKAGKVKLTCPEHKDADVTLLIDGTLICSKGHRLWPPGEGGE